MIIFLDIDGVLHPQNAVGSSLFSKRNLFESVLRDAPHVRVVISSTWREEMPLVELLNFFSADVRPQIFSVTPVINDEISEYWRYEEIRSWIKQNRYAGAWVALDDAAREFPPDLPQLVRCDPLIGFDNQAALKLASAIAKNSQPT